MKFGGSVVSFIAFSRRKMPSGTWECNRCGAPFQENCSVAHTTFEFHPCIAFARRSNVRFPLEIGLFSKSVFGDRTRGIGGIADVRCGSCKISLGFRTDPDDWSDPQNSGNFFIRTRDVFFRRSGVVIDDSGAPTESVTEDGEEKLSGQLKFIVDQLHSAKCVADGCQSQPHPFAYESRVSIDVWYATLAGMLETRQLILEGGLGIAQLAVDGRMRVSADAPIDAKVRLANVEGDPVDVPVSLLMSVVNSLCISRAANAIKAVDV